ncbi:hypothetical protein RND81_01G124400 [Saponaria officinalis]|uniref:Vacuolar protein sorting-associated protein 62 n=1 Tax=Saponaria officinalis TaxID=3572 RepID=A0AAW1NGJ0_SAPOF
MVGCKFMYGNYSKNNSSDDDTFSLPAPLPQWPQGQGFSTGKIRLREIEVAEITTFEFIWSSHSSHNNKKGVAFYKPVGIPEGFFSLGHYCQPNNKPLHGFVLVARDLATSNSVNDTGPVCSPALLPPCDYSLVWKSDDGIGNYEPPGYFWLPESPPRYKALGFVVTNMPGKPDWADVKCVREDLVDKSESCGLLLETYSKFHKIPFEVRRTRPCHRGMLGRGVSTGTFFCASLWNAGEEMPISCLKNSDPDLRAMPNLDQIHSLIRHYGPTVFFHPKEVYLPSSISWFFENGVRLCKVGQPKGESVDPDGSNLPAGGSNDGEFWLDFPTDDQREVIKHGNLESAELYVHVKPALGGTFTDIAMWVFSPFNGPATFKIGPTNIALSRTGEHVGDWEHFTLRISNFTGRLDSIYFSQHSGGVWIDASDLEFIEGNRAIVYSSKNGHASYPHPGTYLQGSSKLGVGIRNDCARSKLYVDSSTRYQIIAAEYLGTSVSEPCWLQFMREWGPKIVYGSRKELDKLIKRLPLMIRGSVRNLFNKLPAELSGEEGPTGPKEKNNWFGDESW